jgi:hypothetical protein
MTSKQLVLATPDQQLVLVPPTSISSSHPKTAASCRISKQQVILAPSPSGSEFASFILATPTSSSDFASLVLALSNASNGAQLNITFTMSMVSARRRFIKSLDQQLARYA